MSSSKSRLCVTIFDAILMMYAKNATPTKEKRITRVFLPSSV